MTHHCSKHRSSARHRRTTIGDHVKRLTAIAAAALAVIASLYAVPTPADAKPSYSQSMSDDEGAVDYGSGKAGGPVGSPVKSTVPYTAISDWMIVGDSITVRGYKELLPLTPGKRLAVDAWSGRNTKMAVDSVLETLAAVGPIAFPKKVVWATGANDVFTPGVVAAELSRLLDALPEGVQVFFVDTQVARPAFPADQRNCMWVNSQIWMTATAHGAKVISWATFLASKPGRIASYIDAGGVHPTLPTATAPNSGTKAWASLIATAVQP